MGLIDCIRIKLGLKTEAGPLAVNGALLPLLTVKEISRIELNARKIRIDLHNASAFPVGRHGRKAEDACLMVQAPVVVVSAALI